MNDPTPLPLPMYIGTPRTETATCPTCGEQATAEIRFVALSYDGPEFTLESARGVYEPAIYECANGHCTMESEI
jgi:hypothetical protein